ncbi:MAG: ribonuclease R [Gammaproteobacteria bacterium]|nr:ribonuclease R [Gammaproteobacteria bacterium]
MSKKIPKRDPFLKREKSKYVNPIPSREFILLLLENYHHPVTLKRIAVELKISGEEKLEALRRRLRAMERDGELLFNHEAHGYTPMTQSEEVTGRIIGHADGFGFLVPATGGEDLFLSTREMERCLHGDLVVARVVGTDRRGRREGKVMEVLEHAHRHVAGRFHVEHGQGFVVPDNRRINQPIAISESNRFGVKDGQLVVVEILTYPGQRVVLSGRVVEILGDYLAHGMEIDLAIRAHDIPSHWSPLVEAESHSLPLEVSEQDKRGRIDITHLPLVTIDGPDSRDFDDAVYCEKEGKGWRILVAIADVSHYVNSGTALDAEARLRGNSVYFPGRVVPMLPEGLSNILCSLNPEVERLCMVCDMEIGPRGKVKGYRFYPAVMRSHARLTYDEVAAVVVARDAATCHKYEALRPHLEELYQLYRQLVTRRRARGAIDFETSETQFIFGETGKIDNIVPTQRNDAHRIIEECMLLANTAAADYLKRGKISSLYRVHDEPVSDKVLSLRQFLAEIGLFLKGGDKPKARDYAELLASVRGREDFGLIQTVMLRSLSQAIYTPENRGHFGLSYDAYTHFTSPIRRYPDLLVHRAIKHLLSGNRTPFRYSAGEMITLGEHCSMTERRADEATRDASDWLKCEYMQERIGEVFDGMITSVTSFGLFVQLTGVYVEGLVHISSLKDDYYQFDAQSHRLIGERKRRIFRLCDSLQVKLDRVDLEDRKISFTLA